MAIFSRAKRVTDPPDDDAKARIFRHVSSSIDQDQESPPLFDLVHGFLEDVHQEDSHDSDLSENHAMEEECSGEASEEIVRMALSFSDSDSYRNLLLAHVLRAVEAYSSLRSRQESVFREKVASFLRELGHDAAVCVSKWSSTAKLVGGSYDFIDVLYHKTTDGRIRYFVDLDFASEFHIARPTSQYARVLQMLPRVFVGREESLGRIVRESCNAAKKSLKSRGLSLPPWRRSSYMQRKWFGPHKRRVGSSFGVFPSNIDAVKCRFKGFDDAVNTRLFIRT